MKNVFLDTAIVCLLKSYSRQGIRLNNNFWLRLFFIDSYFDREIRMPWPAFVVSTTMITNPIITPTQPATAYQLLPFLIQL